VRLLPRNRRGSLWRFFIAAVLIICSTAAATAVAGLLQFKQFAVDLSATPALPHANVTLPPPGAPQTVLVIGSDHRAGTSFNSANTDTMLLVRLDDNSQTINIMSIPRDLQVTIPGVGVGQKINGAYSAGGPNLLIKTIKQNAFPNLHVNHIIDVNFHSFQTLVDAIGCVYSDVDHRYYNNTLITGYSSIDIQPGYQKLCGADALAFVRFRHTDSDIVRNARQQDFIRWAKDQYGVGGILANRAKLLRIFGQNTQTDHNLHTTDGLINLFDLVVNGAGHRIQQVRFPAILHACPPDCNVTADPSAEAAAFNTFIKVTTAVPASKRSNPGRGKKRKGAKLSTVGLVADTADGKAQEAALSGVGMPVFYPKLIVGGGGTGYCSSLTGLCPLETASPGSYPRSYRLRDRRGHPYPAYRMTLVLNSMLGQYYGVQGTTWQNPPLLSSPLESKVVNGKTLEIYEQGGSITDVAWHTKAGVYWVSNTLTTDISNHQMINIAASLSR